MKRLLVFLGLVLLHVSAISQVVEVERRILGSGQQDAAGFENATIVYDNIFHVPQYLPGYPTARSVWPRVIDLPCRREASGTRCDGYNWSPALGRGEYLFFRPVIAVAPVRSGLSEGSDPPAVPAAPLGAAPVVPPPAAAAPLPRLPAVVPREPRN